MQPDSPNFFALPPAPAADILDTPVFYPGILSLDFFRYIVYKNTLVPEIWRLNYVRFG